MIKIGKLRGNGSVSRNAMGTDKHIGNLEHIIQLLTAELHEANQKFRRLVEESSDGITVIDEEGRVIEWNTAQEKLTGLPRAEVIDRPVWDVQFQFAAPQNRTPQGYEALKAMIQAFLQTGNAPWLGKVVEIEIQRPDGEHRMFQTAVFPIKTEKGSMAASISRDVTEQKQIQEALRQSEERFRELVNSTDDIVFTLDKDQRHTGIYGRWLSFMGASPEMFLGKAAREIMGDDAAPIHEEANQQVLDGGESVIYEWNDNTNYYQTSLAPLHDSEGNISGLVGIGRNITALKQAETALRRRVEEFRAIVEHTPDIISRVDRNLRYVYINPIIEKVTGIPAYAYLGKTDADLANDPEVVHVWQAGLRSVFETGQEHTLEFSYKNSLTGERWYHSRMVPEFAPDGTVETVLSISRDVSRRKLAERELEVTNARLYLLNRVISVASTTLNVQTVLEAICREFADFLNVPYAVAALLDGWKATRVAEYRTDGQASALDTDPPPLPPAVYDTLMRSRKPIVIEDTPLPDVTVHSQTRSLMLVPIFVRDSLIGLIQLESAERQHFSEEETTLILMAAQAVSQSVENCLLHKSIADHNTRLAEQVERRTAQYQRLNERMSAILNSVSDAILLLQTNGTIDITNPTFDRQFGYQADELFGLPVEVISTEPYQNDLMQTIQQVLEDGEPRRVEFVACRKNGDFFDADMAVALVKNHETSLVCSVRDVSAFKEIDRVKDNFISMVSHELRTPISVMTLVTGGMRKYYERMTDEQRLKKLEQIETQAAVLAELVESVLDISRMDARQKQRGTEAVDMTEIALKVVMQLRPTAEVKQQMLDLSLETSPIVLKGDAIDFSRIWRNLINNAIKYTPEKGKIFVRLGLARRTGHGHVLLPASFVPANCAFDSQDTTFVIGQIEDNGHGIQPEDFPYLFTRFFRGWAKQSGIPGTGLGLSLVRELLDIYGGGIQVNSAVDMGSVFTFWLPLT